MRNLWIYVLGTIGLVVVGLALLAVGELATPYAGNILKTFELGPGTGQSRSHVRTFPIPCHLEVAAVVKFRRDGSASASDVPILVELRRPDVGPNQEGEVISNQSVTAKPDEQTVILRAPKQNRGCSLPWRVRVQHANDGAAPLRVHGSIRLDFDDRLREVPVTGGQSRLNKGQSTTKNIGGVEGFEQGAIEMIDNWNHSVAGLVKGPYPVKLRFELIDPSGAVVKTVEAYSSNEARSELPKFKLAFQVESCVSGQWKVRITNIDPNHDASNIGPSVKFTPACPN